MILPQSGVTVDFATPDRAAWLINSFLENLKKSSSDVYRQYVDGDSIEELLNETCYPFNDSILGQQEGLMFFTFETANAEMVGGVILSLETPWYAKKGTLLSLSEVATLAVPGHHGITRMVIELMEYLAKDCADCPVVVCAGASIPETEHMVSNSYRKENFNEHPIFYKLILNN